MDSSTTGRRNAVVLLLSLAAIISFITKPSPRMTAKLHNSYLVSEVPLSFRHFIKTMRQLPQGVVLETRQCSPDSPPVHPALHHVPVAQPHRAVHHIKSSGND